MATLEKIRSRGGVLIIIIGLALFAFIVGDMLKSGSSILGQAQREIAEVNGTSVMIDEYQSRVDQLAGIYKMNTGQANLDAATMEQIQSQVWNGMVQEMVMVSEYEELGVAISADELFDLYVGDNPHAIAKSMFRNPETGAYDRGLALNFLKSLELDETGERSAYQMFMESEIVKQRSLEKYNTLIAKGLYANSKELALNTESKKQTKDIEFFSKSYYSIPDSLVEVTQSEVNSFYNDHKDRYKQEESREVQYITFDIVPSSEDVAEVDKWSKKVKSELESINELAEVKQYVALNSDNQFSDVNVSLSDVPAKLTEFVSTSEVGAVYGPYKDGMTYKVAKIAAFNMLPDSVEARHILLRSKTPEKLDAMADSLIEILIAKTTTFEAVAAEFSEDTGSKEKGGALGWFKEGMMVKPFSDACFNGKIKDIVKVNSQYGIHIIEILNQSTAVKKVKLAVVDRTVVPSTETYRNIYSQASKFVGENNTAEKFEEGVKAKGFKKNYGRNLGKNDKSVGALENPREMVRWAFNNEISTISPIFEFGDKFVLAVLSNVREEGYRPVEDVAQMIKAELLKEKKAEMIIADINAKKADSKSLTSLAKKVEAAIKSADGVNFSSYQVKGAGIEPALVGAVSVASKGEISAPVKGLSGVYVFRVTNEVTSDSKIDIAAERSNQLRQNAYRVNYQAFNALKEEAEIVDNRARFY